MWIGFLLTRDDFVWGHERLSRLGHRRQITAGAKDFHQGRVTLSEDLLRVFGETQYYEAIARTIGGPNLDDSTGRGIGTGTFAWTVLAPLWRRQVERWSEKSPVISVIELYVTPFDRMGEMRGIVRMGA